MKRFLILLILFLSCPMAFGEESFEFDMKNLDNPFAGQKIVTDKEFDQAIDQMTTKNKKKKKEPGAFARWFWGAPKNVEPTPVQVQQQFDKLPSEMGAKDTISTKPILTIGAQIRDDYGILLPSGHYQVDFKKLEGQNYIVFMQAHQTIGKFKAAPCSDDYNKNLIIYSRVINMNDGRLKIIFSNLDGTHQGFAKIVD